MLGIIYVELIKLIGNVLCDSKENYGHYDINESFTDVTGFYLAISNRLRSDLFFDHWQRPDPWIRVLDDR